MTRIALIAVLITFTCLIAGCGDSTPTKSVSGGGSTTPGTTPAPIPKDAKPKMD